MSEAPRLFEQGLIRTRLKRAIRQGAEDFLLARASADLSDRLMAVMRQFDTVLDLGTPGPHSAEALRASGKVDRLIRAAPIVEAIGQGEFQPMLADAGLLLLRLVPAPLPQRDPSGFPPCLRRLVCMVCT